ncbi:mitochondrial carrier domain-containing protein [Mycena olivaceomarginata]|nr:mitochondrial carrier domain-containing protein [Mycena olivaceomarginata]
MRFAGDHAVAGIGAGTVAVLCMNPLDLLKVKFQVATTNPSGGIGSKSGTRCGTFGGKRDGKGLYRGLGANVAGNASSWGLYFLFYNMLKKRASDGDPSAAPLSSGAILLCSAQASAVTAIMTNPIWVVKVRMFTTRADSPNAYRSVLHGFSACWGLFRGTSLALFGVSNGAIQFVVYERMKRWGFEVKKRQYQLAGRPWTVEADKLSNTAYSVMSGGSKLAALSLTYPYQVVRSRIQFYQVDVSRNNATSHLYPTIPATVRRTWAQEGVRGFYRGLGTNLVRVLPGTCITFVVYENIAWLLRSTAEKRDQAAKDLDS